MIDAPEAIRALVAALGTAAPLISLTSRKAGRPPIPDTPEAALLAPRRRALYESIQRAPGTTAKEVKRQLDMAEGVFAQHLDKLERVGLVEARLILGQRHLYPTGQAPPEVEEAITNQTSLDIARILIAHPDGISTAEIATASGVPQRTAQFHVRKLLERRLVRQHGDGRRVLYSPVEKLCELVEKTQ